MLIRVAAMPCSCSASHNQLIPGAPQAMPHGVCHAWPHISAADTKHKSSPSKAVQTSHSASHDMRHGIKQSQPLCLPPKQCCLQVLPLPHIAPALAPQLGLQAVMVIAPTLQLALPKLEEREEHGRHDGRLRDARPLHCSWSGSAKLAVRAHQDQQLLVRHTVTAVAAWPV